MECPRCGFQQPEELYCARCGVHLPSAIQSRRRKTLVALMASALAFVLLGATAAIWWFKQRPGSEPASALPPEERQSIPRIQPPPPLPGPATRAHKTSRPSPGQKSPSASRKTKAPEQISESEEASKSSPTPPSQPFSSQPTESNPEAQLKRWAAQEWLDRARELEVDPEQEMEMYRRALEVDPGYALVHYHLGMLHWRKGEKETALEEFRKYWQGASPDERTDLPLPEGILPEELGVPLGE